MWRLLATKGHVFWFLRLASKLDGHIINPNEPNTAFAQGQSLYDSVRVKVRKQCSTLGNQQTGPATRSDRSNPWQGLQKTMAALDLSLRRGRSYKYYDFRSGSPRNRVYSFTQSPNPIHFQSKWFLSSTDTPSLLLQSSSRLFYSRSKFRMSLSASTSSPKNSESPNI